MKCLAVVFSRC